ncbi:MAG: hypothetical protein ABI867_34365 [Kofleriaceae bacterium]
MRAVAALAITIACSACSLGFQQSVRGRSVYCSTSRFWYLSDLLIGGAATYVLATKAQDAPGIAYAPGGLFLGSAALGIYKRHNCVRWRETAPQAEWDRMAMIAEAERVAAAEQAARWQAAQEEAMRQQAAYAQQQAELIAQQQAQLPAQQPPPPQWQPPPGPAPIQSRPSPPPTITIVRHAATDEIGKSCSSNDNAWPQAGGCQYGAVCYHRSCTVWCGNDGSCPVGKRCAFTTGTTPTKLCQ